MYFFRNVAALSRWLGAGRAQSSRASGRFLTGTYANEAGSRDYKLYVPTAYRGKAMPLLVMLHGCKQDPDDFAAGTRMNELAEEKGFLVAYPAQARSANTTRCWNWFQPADQQRDAGEPSLIAGITREVMAEYTVDRARVYIAGLSAGGAMAAIMGATYPDLYAAIGVHSGLPYGAAGDLASALAAMRGMPSPPPRSAREVPTIVFHGDLDTTVHPSNGMRPVARTSRLGWVFPVQPISVESGEANGKRYTRTVRTNWRGRPKTEHWLVHGAGHAWSGGDLKGSYSDPRGPDASRTMLRFFLAKP